MPENSRKFDIVLVATYFRSAIPYLCLIKCFANKYRIGVYATPVPEDLREKVVGVQDQFVAECISLGAELVTGTGIQTDLMIVQQRPYEDETVNEIRTSIRAERTVCLMGLASAGLGVQDACIRQFAVAKVYVPNRRLMNFLVDRRGATEFWKDTEIVQVGLPYADIPLFSEFSTDWLIASPTTFSFRNETQRRHYLRTMLSLLDEIGPEDKVVYKPHNGDQRDSMGSLRTGRLASILRNIPGAERVLGLVASEHGRVQRAASRLLNVCLHQRILARCTPLEDMTSKHWMALEAFLPGVRKGVIGGLSNTIWGSLYFGLPFYNCVDQSLRNKLVPDTAGGFKRSDKHLDMNLEFFDIPYCHGRLDSGACGDAVIVDEDRQGSLVDAIEADLNDLRTNRVAAVV